MTTASPFPPPTRLRLLLWVAAAVLPIVALAALGALATRPGLHWYGMLRRPSFRPPDGAAGPIWLMTAGLTGWAFFRVLRAPDWMPDRPAAIRAFLVQATLAAAWPFAFFTARSALLGVLASAAATAALAVTARLFWRVDRTAGRCLWPALAWATLVTLIALSIYIRN